MKRIKTIWKGILILTLCITLLVSFIGMPGKDIRARSIHSEIKLTSALNLNEGTDIAKYLKGIRVVIPPAHIDKEVNITLAFEPDDGSPAYLVTSGKAKPGKYILHVSILLKDGSAFARWDQLKSTLNGKLATMQVPVGGGQPPLFETEEAECYWNINASRIYKVTFDPKGGLPKPKTQWLTDNQKVKKPKNPTKPGFEFRGWGFYIAPGVEQYFDFNEVISGYGSIDLIAFWKALPTTATTTTTTTTTTAATTTTTTPATTTTTTTTTAIPTTTTTVPPTTILIEITTTEPLTEETTTTEEITTTEETTTIETEPETTSTTETERSSESSIFSSETTKTEPTEDLEGEFKLPWYVYIIGGAILLWAVLLIIFFIMYKKRKNN